MLYFPKVKDDPTERIRVADYVTPDPDSDDGVPVVRSVKSKHPDRGRPGDSGTLAAAALDQADHYMRKHFGAGLSTEAKKVIAGYTRRAVENSLRQVDLGTPRSLDGPLHWLLVIVLACAAAFVINTLSSNGDAVASAIVARMDAQDDRITTIEADVENFRYATGKLIEYQIQENYKTCTRDAAEARALNWIAERLPDSDDVGKRYEPIYVTCEQNPLLPEDLAELLTHARRVDNERR